jgi:hypothetical protein
MRKVSAVLAVAVAMSVSLVAQQRTTTVHMNNPQPAKAPLLPYTAEYKTTRVQTLANGATITLESAETTARDAQGRTMISTTTNATTSTDSNNIRTNVNVNDPVTRTRSSWTVPGHTVTVTQLPAPGERSSTNCATTIAPKSPNTPTRSPVVRDKPTTEDLGTETIMGLEAQGRRMTTVIPAGQIGNDEPLARTSENWFAMDPGYKPLILRRISEDPQQGKSAMELTAFTQGDPDPSLFRPPSEYEVVTREANTGCSSSSTSTTAPVAAQE